MARSSHVLHEKHNERPFPASLFHSLIFAEIQGGALALQEYTYASTAGFTIRPRPLFCMRRQASNTSDPVFSSRICLKYSTYSSERDKRSSAKG